MFGAKQSSNVPGLYFELGSEIWGASVYLVKIKAQLGADLINKL